MSGVEIHEHIEWLDIEGVALAEGASCDWTTIVGGILAVAARALRGPV